MPLAFCAVIPAKANKPWVVLIPSPEQDAIVVLAEYASDKDVRARVDRCCRTSPTGAQTENLGESNDEGGEILGKSKRSKKKTKRSATEQLCKDDDEDGESFRKKTKWRFATELPEESQTNSSSPIQEESEDSYG